MPYNEQRLTPPPSEREPPQFKPLDGTRTARLGRYQIIGALASGGMGTVYLCRHSGQAGFRRLYALKLIHDHLAQDPESIEMLLEEARLASRIHHVNVIPILDLGVHEGRHYLVMDYVEGCSLSQLCRRHRKRRPPRRIIPLLIDALDGLHAAHTLVDDDGTALRLVHRDMSPQNVLVGVDGVARVIDFGIAKATARNNSTAAGMLKGKIAYMSPEQLVDPDKVDARSDIFALGIVMWNVLTGEQLFRAKTDPETLRNVVRQPILPPSEVGLRPPACFDAICLKALERKPRARFQSAAEMADALRRVALENGLLAPRSEIAQWVGASFQNEFSIRRATIRQRMSLPSIDVRLDQIDEVESLPSITGEAGSLRSGVQTRDTEEKPPRRRRRWGAWLAMPIFAIAAYAGFTYIQMRPADAPAGLGDGAKAEPPETSPGAEKDTPVTVTPASAPEEEREAAPSAESLPSAEPLPSAAPATAEPPAVRNPRSAAPPKPTTPAPKSPPSGRRDVGY